MAFNAVTLGTVGICRDGGHQNQQHSGKSCHIDLYSDRAIFIVSNNRWFDIGRGIERQISLPGLLDSGASYDETGLKL